MVNLVKRMITVDKRPSWGEIRMRIYEILGIGDSVEIVTSTGQYMEYVNNLAVLGTCLLHYIDRIKEELEEAGVDAGRMLRVLMCYLGKLASY